MHRVKFIFWGLILVLNFSPSFVFSQEREEPFIIPEVKETIGRIEKINDRSLEISLPKGNVMSIPIYDEERIKEMSERITLEVLITKDTKIFQRGKIKIIDYKNLKIGDTVMVKSKEDMAKNKRVTGEEITILGHYKIQEER